MGERIRIPHDAGEFFERFFPEQFARDRDRYPRTDSPGAALFEVFGVGAWRIKIDAGHLIVKRGRGRDVLLQIGVSSVDFEAIFVERAQREVDVTGDLSDTSRDVFKPLFVDSAKGSALALPGGGSPPTLAFRLHHDGTARHLFVTPGPSGRTAPRTTISMDLEDFLALLSGRRSAGLLFVLGRLRIRGDVLYAVRMRSLLS